MILNGRNCIDLKEIQTLNFESRIKNCFINPINHLINVFFENGKFLKLDKSGEIKAISNFENIESIYFDKYILLLSQLN